jgi:AraC-like DNA-binding protein/mannose-6-phosphate isomerase-like protein (cupin superfamily)
MKGTYSNSYLNFKPIEKGEEFKRGDLFHQDLQAKKVAMPLFKAGVLRVVWACKLNTTITANEPHSNLFLMVQGKMSLAHDGAEHLLLPGEMVFVPPNSEFSIKNGDDKNEISFIRIRIKRLEMWKPLVKKGFFVKEIRWFDMIYVCLRRILLAYEGEEGYPLSSALGDAVFMTQLLRRIRNLDDQESNGGQASPIGALNIAINANPAENWTLETMSKFCHVSPRTLSRETHRKFGLSPAQVVIQSRMREAKKLLCEGLQTIQKISLSVGYQSLQTFSSQFKKNSGFSPGNYRKMMTED